MSEAATSATCALDTPLSALPKVSVAMHTYRQEKYIRQAIDSALMQKTNFAFEIVIGDDCSPDRTREIVLEHQQRFPQTIRPVLREKNVGPWQNFTQTVRACRGQYIAVLDGDDYWTSPHKLQRQVDFLDSHPECAMCFHSVRSTFDDGHFVFAYPPGRKSTYTLENILLKNFIPSVSAVFRRGLFGEFPSWFCDRRVIGDWTLHILNAEYGTIGYLDEDMAVYRIHSGGMFTGGDDRQRAMYRIEFLEFLNAQLQYRYDRIVKRTVSNFHIEVVNFYVIKGERKLAWKSLIKAIATAPLYQMTHSKKLPRLLVSAYFPRLTQTLIFWKHKLTPRAEIKRGIEAATNP